MTVLVTLDVAFDAADAAWEMSDDPMDRKEPALLALAVRRLVNVLPLPVAAVALAVAEAATTGLATGAGAGAGTGAGAEAGGVLASDASAPNAFITPLLTLLVTVAATGVMSSLTVFTPSEIADSTRAAALPTLFIGASVGVARQDESSCPSPEPAR